MAFQQRSPTKFAPSDWHTSNFVISSSAERQRSNAHNIRQQSQKIINETESKTKWTQHDTDTRLDERVGDIKGWMDTLSKTLQDTEEEIGKLSESKQCVERALEAKIQPLDVVLQCLSTREQRVSIDQVRDEVEASLHKEFETIEGIRSMLHQKMNEAFEQICVLQDCHQQLHADLTDKHSGLEIDSDCSGLENTSENIAMQTDPTRIKKGIVTPNQWESFSTHNTAQAEAEIQISVRLREAMNHTIRQTTSDLQAQWAATNFAFRKRIHEMEQAKRELEWQQKNTEVEIGSVESEIKHLQSSLAEKTPPMMVVQTRLENRTQRPNVELCRDPAQYGMVEEVTEISDSQQSLKRNLDIAEHALGALNRTLGRIIVDLEVKNTSLKLDQECMLLRETLAQHPQADELTKPKS